MAQMIDALKATVEAEKTKLLAEASRATEAAVIRRSQADRGLRIAPRETCPIAGRLIDRAAQPQTAVGTTRRSFRFRSARL
jgi:hypothetical protein